MSQMMQTQLILSNQIDPLIEELSSHLFSKICKRKLIVPDDQFKTFLLLRLVEISKDKIAMGMETMTLKELMPHKSDALALRLEYEIIRNWEKSLYASLIHYFKKTKMALSAFCPALARTFFRYALYGGEELQQWLCQSGWQQDLFKTHDFSLDLPQGYEWHIFGFNHLPIPIITAFKNVGATFYCVSPCQEFWEDLCSHKERAYLRNHLSHRGQEALEEYLEDHHPLLANLGKKGRNFLKAFDDIPIFEKYQECDDQTVLEKIQKSILSLTSFVPGDDDHSIQLYPAHSLLQEVEILYAVLHELMIKENIEPKDVQVIAKEIDLYVPLIHMIFGREGGVIPYSLRNINFSSENFFARGFLHLLQIPKNRFDVFAILELFSNPSFQAKQQLSEFDIEKITYWAEKTGVFWGMDALQREKLLGQAMLEKSELGTWKHCFYKLFLGFAQIGPDLPFVGISDMELLTKFLGIMTSLQKDLQPLVMKEKRSLSAWQEWIRQVATSYFQLDQEELKLLKTLDRLFLTLNDLNDPIYEFSSVFNIVENLFKSHRGKYKTSQLQSVLFSSFPEGSLPSKKVTWMLGLSDEEFPGIEKADPFSELSVSGIKVGEQDRYLFLEAILSTQKFLCISYQNISSKDHKKQGPSSVVQELFSFVQKPYSNPKKLPGLHRLKKESAKPFFKSFSESTPIEKPLLDQEKNIDIKQLEKCAKHPIRFYLQEKLGIYFEKSSEKHSEFILSRFSQANVRNAALKTNLLDALSQENLPLGRFKEAAVYKLSEELKRDVDFEVGEVFSYNLNHNPYYLDLKNGKTLLIRGILNHITKNGFLFYGRNQMADLLKIWPSYLLFLTLFQENSCLDLILFKDGKKLSPPQYPECLLRKYITYYELCLKFPSPLMPAWGKALLEGSVEEFVKEMKKENTQYSDDYLDWLKKRDPSINPEMIFNNWSEVLRELFADFTEWRKG